MTIYICGDSTAAAYAPEHAPITGWGMVLAEWLPGVRVDNRAMAGRSSKSYLAEGRLAAFEQLLQPGDLVLIQFGHNDTSSLVWRHTEARTSFVNCLSIYVETARLHGAQPVLMTPTPCRLWENGALRDSHGDHLQAIRDLAEEKNVPLIDVYARAMEDLRAMGEEASKALFMHVEPGVYQDYPNGATDNTHTRRPGAELFARLTLQGLQDLQLL